MVIYENSEWDMFSKCSEDMFEGLKEEIKRLGFREQENVRQHFMKIESGEGTSKKRPHSPPVASTESTKRLKTEAQESSGTDDAARRTDSQLCLEEIKTTLLKISVISPELQAFFLPENFRS